MAIGSMTSQAWTFSLTEKIQRFGSTIVDGGVHPHFGTRNFTPPLQNGHYMEVVYSLDYPITEQVHWGQAASKKTHEGGSWLTWVHAADAIPKIQEITIPDTDHLSDSWFKTETLGGLIGKHFKFIDSSANDGAYGIVADRLTIPSGVVKPD